MFWKKLKKLLKEAVILKYYKNHKNLTDYVKLG